MSYADAFVRLCLCSTYKSQNGEAGIGTQIRNANFHRGSAPLASLRSCHPDDVGKSFPHTPLGFESRPPQSKQHNGEAGIRTRGTSLSPYDGLANRYLQPLGHLSKFLKYKGLQIY